MADCVSRAQHVDTWLNCLLDSHPRRGFWPGITHWKNPMRRYHVNAHDRFVLALRLERKWRTRGAVLSEAGKGKEIRLDRRTHVCRNVTRGIHGRRPVDCKPEIIWLATKPIRPKQAQRMGLG